MPHFHSAFGGYEMLVDRKAGVPPGSEIRIGRLTFAVVGLTDGIVSNAGDPAAFVALQDAQEIQFLKPNDSTNAIRLQLSRGIDAAEPGSDWWALGPGGCCFN